MVHIPTARAWLLEPHAPAQSAPRHGEEREVRDLRGAKPALRR